jgi:hypothetical protein
MRHDGPYALSTLHLRTTPAQTLRAGTELPQQPDGTMSCRRPESPNCVSPIDAVTGLASLDKQRHTEVGPGPRKTARGLPARGVRPTPQSPTRRGEEGISGCPGAWSPAKPESKRVRTRVFGSRRPDSPSAERPIVAAASSTGGRSPFPLPCASPVRIFSLLLVHTERFLRVHCELSRGETRRVSGVIVSGLRVAGRRGGPARTTGSKET